MSSEPVLPMADTTEAYDLVRDDEGVLRPGVNGLFRHLGVEPAPAARFPTGSLPVYGADDVVLKLFPQVHVEEYPVEAAVLTAVNDKLPIATPRLLACGERDGWGYVLMSRLPGVSLDTVWGQTTQDQRDRLADDLGAAVAALHALPLPEIDDWWPSDWDAFVTGQRADCLDRQRARGLPETWLAQIPDALNADLTSRAPVLLHTEIMREHLLVHPDPAGGWRYSGLIDFEPAMRGNREYEFVGIGCFVAQGDHRFLGRVLRAYGYADHELDRAFQSRMMAWALLHYYSNLPRWMKHLPEPTEPTFDALADRWFGTSPLTGM